VTIAGLAALGRWLVENVPRIDDLELPDRREPERPSPFEGSEYSRKLANEA
jgi:hypothetical protein